MNSHLDYPIWLQNLSNPNLSKTIEVLATTVRSVLSDITTNHVSDIDKKLGLINVLEAPPSHLLAVLTSLFTWRTELPQWSLLRDKAYNYYIEKNIRGVDNAFKGLFH